MLEGAKARIDELNETDSKERGLHAAYESPHAAVKTWLLDQGYTDGVDLKIRRFEGAGHNEAAWREKVADQLDWLLGQGR